MSTLHWDYSQKTESFIRNFNGSEISPLIIKKILYPKISKVLDQIKKFTNIKIDHLSGGFYSDTNYINFSWHQDHGAYYLYQQATNYLNFYIMVKKENIEFILELLTTQ